MTRHQMRQCAFMLTFERVFNDENIDSLLQTAKENDFFEIDNQAEALFRNVDAKKPVLDEEISKYLKNWSIERISKVSLCILRIAMYEIMFCDDIDTDIAISEAVKLAQEFSLKDDVAFVNGVLSSVSKELKKSETV